MTLPVALLGDIVHIGFLKYAAMPSSSNSCSMYGSFISLLLVSRPFFNFQIYSEKSVNNNPSSYKKAVNVTKNKRPTGNTAHLSKKTNQIYLILLNIKYMDNFVE